MNQKPLSALRGGRMTEEAGVAGAWTGLGVGIHEKLCSTGHSQQHLSLYQSLTRAAAAQGG